MRKADVAINSVYLAKVSGQLAPVRITDESPFGGWNGINVLTGYGIRIKSAQRLRRKLIWDASSHKWRAA